MPRPPLGSPNSLGARCPECGQVLVIEHYRRLRSREYVCPAAKLEKLLSEGSHRSLWHWREEELVPLSRGERTPWHDYFGLNNR